MRRAFSAGMERLAVFALNATRDLGERTGRALGVPLAAHEERDFEDGEHKARPQVSVRDQDVYVIQSLHGDDRQSVNDKLCRLLFFLSTLRDAGARRVTAVVPYLCYARKERRTRPRDPVTTRYLAALIEASGVDRVVAVDVHDLAAFQNAYRVRAEHLEARPVLVAHVAAHVAAQPVVVVSPDAGGFKRADRFRAALEARLGQPVGMAFLEKARSEGVVRSGAVVGDVSGALAVIVDDLISTGTTLARAAQACHARGALRCLAVATHGLFVDPASRVLAEAPLERVIVTDTVPAFRLDPLVLRARVTVLDLSHHLAEAIRRLHHGDSLVELLEDVHGRGT